MPASFDPSSSQEQLWVPQAFTPERKAQHDEHHNMVVGLLKPGAAMTRAQSELTAVQKELNERYPNANGKRTVSVRSIADVVGPLDRALRNTRVLARRVLVSARLGETMPPDYLELMDRLAAAVETMARDLASNRPPYSAQPALRAIGEETAKASSPLTLSAAVVLGQIRSLVVDLLELSGLSSGDAISAVPNR